MPELSVLESKERLLQLTEGQAEALRALGRELRGKADFLQRKAEPAELEDREGEQEDSRTVIRCSSEGNGMYRVHVSNAIGVVAIPGDALRIYPKIPISHFAHLAKKSYSAARIGSESVSVSSLDAFWELVAQWCVTSLEHLIRFGLLMDYKSFDEDLSVVRGRANIRSTTNNFLNGKILANCTFDELNIDHPLNRILRATARRIAGSEKIADQTLKKRASRIDRILEGVGPMLPSDLETPLDRRTAAYAESLDLCKRVLGLVGTNLSSGENAGRTFLIPTPGLIEDGIRNVLRESLRPISVKAGHRNVKGNASFSINPDLVFGEGTVTGDVKYKVATDQWNRGDVQQAAMFATGYKAHAALIATFSRVERVGDLQMELGNLIIRRIVWNAFDHLEPARSEAQFVRAAKSFLQAHLDDGSLSSIGNEKKLILAG